MATAVRPTATATTPPAPTRLLTDVELAEELALSVYTLRADRRKLRRIPFIKFGTSVRYDRNKARAAVDAYSIGGAQPAHDPIPAQRQRRLNKSRAKRQRK